MIAWAHALDNVPRAFCMHCANSVLSTCAGYLVNYFKMEIKKTWFCYPLAVRLCMSGHTCDEGKWKVYSIFLLFFSSWIFLSPFCWSPMYDDQSNNLIKIRDVLKTGERMEESILIRLAKVVVLTLIRRQVLGRSWAYCRSAEGQTDLPALENKA